jgi:peptidoglycan/xylan/chitin deacetylase (PgdA/CDA1 family)
MGTTAAPHPPRRWEPGAAIKVSAAIHVACLACAVMWPGSWPWMLLAIVLNHAAIGLIGMWPRSRWLGPNMLRLPEASRRRREVALTFDDGPDADITPRVLDLLDRYRAKASFFCVGEKAAAHPEVVREIARRGHSVENHSMRHSGSFGFLGLRGLRAELSQAQDAIASAAGRPPTFFRAPMGIRNPFLDPVVAQLGLTYVTWTRRGFDTVARRPQVVLQRLLRNLAAGDILLLHDRRTGSATPPVLEVLPPLLEKIRADGLTVVSLPMAMR